MEQETPEWEEIEADYEEDVIPSLRMERLKVPGGWLVRSYIVSFNHDPFSGVGLTFLPDPLYQWDPGKVI